MEELPSSFVLFFFCFAQGGAAIDACLRASVCPLWRPTWTLCPLATATAATPQAAPTACRHCPLSSEAGSATPELIEESCVPTRARESSRKNTRWETCPVCSAPDGPVRRIHLSACMSLEASDWSTSPGRSARTRPHFTSEAVHYPPRDAQFYLSKAARNLTG